MKKPITRNDLDLALANAGGGQTYTAGTGIDITNNTISVKDDYVLNTGDTMTGNLNIIKDTAEGSFFVARNSIGGGAYGVEYNGNVGIFDYTNNKWLINSDTSGNVYLNNVQMNVVNTKPTVNTGRITNANNNLILYRYGKVVYFTGWVKISYQVAQYENFAYIPTGYRPTQHCSVWVQNGSERIWCYLDTCGNISPQDNTLKANATYWTSASWICP